MTGDVRSDCMNVMFMQSQTYFGADSFVHRELMRYFDRSRVRVFAACNAGSPADPSAALEALSVVDDLRLRPTYFGPSTNFVSKRVALRRALTGALPTLWSLVQLARYSRANGIDIIHCTEKPRDAFYGLLVARASGARCVIHLHVKVEGWISPLVRWAMGHADGLVGVSEFVVESIIAMGYTGERTYAVLNAMDARGWDGPVDGKPIRAEFGVPADRPLLCVVSRLFHWKGHTELLRALALVKRREPRFTLLIVGEDDPRATIGHGSYSDELKALTAELDLEDNVVFTGFRRDVREVMAASDIYTMPSFEEPFGMVFLEAMALKLPVVALDNGGSREVVQGGVTGLLSAPGDIDALAENIVTLLRDPALRRTMGVAGHQRLIEDFTPQRMADDLEKTYAAVLQARPKRPRRSISRWRR